MKVIINLGEKESTLETLSKMKNRLYAPFDIRITNSHITTLNDLIGNDIFKKDSLYINSFTLWEIMQKIGKRGKHNYHGLTPNDVFMALCSIKDPKCVFIAKGERYAIITTELSHFSIPLMIVVEIGSTIDGIIDENMNKIVTIYPKDNVESILRKMNQKQILYRKK